MRYIFTICSLVAVFFLAGCMHQGSLNSGTPTSGEDLSQAAQANVVCVDATCFQVEIADSPEERARGLMYREELADDAGMLFVFEEMRPGRSFWMKNTLLPLDMLWIDNTQEIVAISHDVPPCAGATPCPTYSPGELSTQYVLEIAGGVSDELGITTGMKVRFDLQE